MICPNCGTSMPDKANFCAVCRTPLKTPAQPPVRQEQAQQEQIQQAPVQQEQVEQAPAQQEQIQQAPVQQEQVQQAPVQQEQIQQEQAQQAPVEQEQIQQAPIEQEQVQQAPVQQAPIEQKPVQPQPEADFCGKCGHKLRAGQSFCALCGNRIEQTAAPVNNAAPESLSLQFRKATSGKSFRLKSDENHWSLGSLFGSFSSRNRRIAAGIAISVLAALVMIIVIICAVISHIYYSSPAGMLAAGSRYLAEMEYEEAIVQFNNLLDIEPNNVQAYILKAKAYIAMGKKERALATLREGYSVTDSDKILDMLEELEEELGAKVPPESKCVIDGYVVDVNKDPLREVEIRARMLSESASVVYGSEENANSSSLPVYNTSTDYQGYWRLELRQGLYVIEYCINGYIYYSCYYESFPEKTETLDTVELHPRYEENIDATLILEVTSGLNYTPVYDAKILLREGWDNRQGEYVCDQYGQTVTAYTGSDGQCSITVRSGMYTAEVSKNGYGTIYANISVAENYYTRLYLAPILEDTDYRIILTWGETPSDLDSHFRGTYSGNDFEVYYSSKEYGDAVNLDIDDTQMYGPETITVYYNSEYGDCEYFVHDFSNGTSSTSTALSASNATIMVYKGAALVAQYNVPTGQSGTCWHVFRLVNGEIIPINTIDSEYSPSYYYY